MNMNDRGNRIAWKREDFKKKRILASCHIALLKLV